MEEQASDPLHLLGHLLIRKHQKTVIIRTVKPDKIITAENIPSSKPLPLRNPLHELKQVVMSAPFRLWGQIVSPDFSI